MLYHNEEYSHSWCGNIHKAQPALSCMKHPPSLMVALSVGELQHWPTLPLHMHNMSSLLLQLGHVHVCVLKTTAVVQWDLSSLFWIPVQSKTQAHFALPWRSLALTWLVVRNHNLYCPSRTDLTNQTNKKARILIIGLHRAKGCFLRGGVSCAKELLPLWKALHGHPLFMWNSSGVRTHRGFYNTYDMLFTLARMCGNPCLLCCSQEKCLFPLIKTSVCPQWGNTKGLNKRSFPQLPSTCLRLSGQVAKPKLTLAFMYGAHYETKHLL